MHDIYSAISKADLKQITFKLNSLFQAENNNNNLINYKLLNYYYCSQLENYEKAQSWSSRRLIPHQFNLVFRYLKNRDYFVNPAGMLKNKGGAERLVNQPSIGGTHP